MWFDMGSFVTILKYKSEWSEKIFLMIGKNHHLRSAIFVDNITRRQHWKKEIENVLIARREMIETLMLQLTSKIRSHWSKSNWNLIPWDSGDGLKPRYQKRKEWTKNSLSLHLSGSSRMQTQMFDIMETWLWKH